MIPSSHPLKHCAIVPGSIFGSASSSSAGSTLVDKSLLSRFCKIAVIGADETNKDKLVKRLVKNTELSGVSNLIPSMPGSIVPSRQTTQTLSQGLALSEYHSEEIYKLDIPVVAGNSKTSVCHVLLTDISQHLFMSNPFSFDFARNEAFIMVFTEHNLSSLKFIELAIVNLGDHYKKYTDSKQSISDTLPKLLLVELCVNNLPSSSSEGSYADSGTLYTHGKQGLVNKIADIYKRHPLDIVIHSLYNTAHDFKETGSNVSINSLLSTMCLSVFEKRKKRL